MAKRKHVWQASGDSMIQRVKATAEKVEKLHSTAAPVPSGPRKPEVTGVRLEAVRRDDPFLQPQGRSPLGADYKSKLAVIREQHPLTRRRVPIV
jgi:hypothetical protein